MHVLVSQATEQYNCYSTDLGAMQAAGVHAANVRYESTDSGEGKSDLLSGASTTWIATDSYFSDDQLNQIGTDGCVALHAHKKAATASSNVILSGLTLLSITTGRVFWCFLHCKWPLHQLSTLVLTKLSY